MPSEYHSPTQSPLKKPKPAPSISSAQYPTALPTSSRTYGPGEHPQPSKPDTTMPSRPQSSQPASWCGWIEFSSCRPSSTQPSPTSSAGKPSWWCLPPSAAASSSSSAASDASRSSRSSSAPSTSGTSVTQCSRSCCSSTMHSILNIARSFVCRGEENVVQVCVVC
uniref:Uncharacterized protein n=1 Tax=Triticum urartu TaxID=4572 RepID=A0A8R7TX70_TRIUA